jgi:NAD kinase
LFLSLYVDEDGFFLFESKEDMKRGMPVLYHHMKHFGLLMHIAGKDGGKLKTEALYTPEHPEEPSPQKQTEARYLLIIQIKE